MVLYKVVWKYLAGDYLGVARVAALAACLSVAGAGGAAAQIATRGQANREASALLSAVERGSSEPPATMTSAAPMPASSIRSASPAA
jgi:hypothetical protein